MQAHLAHNVRVPSHEPIRILTDRRSGVEEVLPMGWTKHTHSDGKPYFYHDHDVRISGFICGIESENSDRK